jgi:hypothetical protein
VRQDGRVPIRPISPQALVTEVVGHVLLAANAAGGGSSAAWLRVAIDGPPAAAPGDLADALVDPLRVAGRPVLRIRAEDFLRPASLRLEYGRTSPDAYYEDWLDEAGLRREVLDPLRPGGSGRVLPSLWDAAADRASRAGYLTLPPGGVAVVSGALLLGGALPFDLTVHLALSTAALARRTPPEQRWTLPAFARYAGEVAPDTFADLVVKVDDPRHPAVVRAPG